MTREEKAIIILKNEQPHCGEKLAFTEEERYEAYNLAVKALEQERTGHWIMHIDDLFPAESTMECSECGEHQPLTIDDNYCPNCGARMET